MPFADYAESFKTIRMGREDGILEMTLHTEGGSLRWGPVAHADLVQAFLEVSRDRENQVVILTGIGEEFSGPEIKPNDPTRAVPKLSATEWGKLGWESKHLLMNMLDIDVPMICALNGPALRHAELPVLCDMVIASDDSLLQDSAHFTGGLIPGDGVHVIFPMLMGLNRARYFLFTGQKLHAAEALRIGLFNEVVPKPQVLPRARELARQLLLQPELNRRYTRLLLTEPIRREMHQMLGHGLALEGLGITS
jgi:enoyl-CoA hydratase/carnithine racemase